MIVETTRFGSIEVDDGSVLLMKRGILGFEFAKKFCLIQHRPDTPFKWLQSVETPDLAFAVIDPLQFISDYEIEISDVDATELELTDPEEAVVLTTVTIKGDEGLVTTNLAGPIVINAKTLVGMQLVLEDERYGTQHIVARAGESRQDESDKVEVDSTLAEAA